MCEFFQSQKCNDFFFLCTLDMFGHKTLTAFVSGVFLKDGRSILSVIGTSKYCCKYVYSFCVFFSVVWYLLTVTGWVLHKYVLISSAVGALTYTNLWYLYVTMLCVNFVLLFVYLSFISY